MAKPRIIIAGTDIGYIFRLQLKFVEEFFEKIDIEIITDENYYNRLFASPQKADILVVSEELYDVSLQRHNIRNIFLMTEDRYEDEQTGELNVKRIHKYSSAKEILNEITANSAEAFHFLSDTKKETQIIMVYSASGGVGKTTVALGMSACLTKSYKRVLYINAGHLQDFQRLLDNPSPITSSDVHTKMSNPEKNLYSNIKHVIRKEIFSYLPPFKAALMSLGLKYSLYEKIAVGAKKSGDYDYIIVDADTTFDEDKIALFGIADKVMIVTDQTAASVFSTNQLMQNIIGMNTDKYVFVCNNFNKNEDNALISPYVTLKFTVSEYIEHFIHYDQMKCFDISKDNGMQKVAFLVI